MAEIINPIAKKCFRFSRQVYKLSDLDSWFDWFAKRNIPCCIEKLNGMYSLWRAGEESNLPDWENKISYKRKIWKITGKIVREYRWNL